MNKLLIIPVLAVIALFVIGCESEDGDQVINITDSDDVAINFNAEYSDAEINEE